MKRLLTLLLLVCALLAVFAVTPARAQNAVLLSPPRLQFINGNGQPYAGGKLYSYLAGTSTPLSTYTDQTATTQNTNPIILDANGFAPPVWIGAASYKFTLTDLNGVVIWTQDNVRDLALLGQNTVSVKTYGAKGDGITDDSGAIGAACTAVGTGTLVFPPATYKIISGNITTCLPGITISGYGATLDVTAAQAAVFAINVGGSVISTAPITLIDGFRVNGSASNSTGLLLRVDNLYDVTLRDLFISGANLAYFAGFDEFATVENVVVSSASATGAAITYSQGPYASTNQPFQSHIDKLNCAYALTCIEADAGEVDISNSVLDNSTTGIHVNGARVSFRDGMINLRNGTSTMRGILIDSAASQGKPTNLDNTLVQMIDSVGTYSSIAIDNNSTNDVEVSADFVINGNSSQSYIVLRSSASALRLIMAKTKVYQYNSSNASGGIFQLTSGSTLLGALSGSTFTAPYTLALNFLVPGSLGTFVNMPITGNLFTGVTNYNQIGGGIMFSSNWFSSGPGTTTAIPFGLTNVANIGMIGNMFFPGLVMTGSHPPAFCSVNLNYSCN